MLQGMNYCSKEFFGLKLELKKVTIFILFTRKGFSVCFDQLEEYIGLTFCGEAMVPMDGLKMFTPSNGPSKIQLKIEKEDKLSIYHFKVYHNTNAGKPGVLLILFELN
jgi:hypothetical protein